MTDPKTAAELQIRADEETDPIVRRALRRTAAVLRSSKLVKGSFRTSGGGAVSSSKTSPEVSDK